MCGCTSQHATARWHSLRRVACHHVVQGAHLKINYAVLGYDVKAFLGVYLEKGALYDEVLEELEAIEEITNIDYTTGNYAMFIKMLCRDTQHLREVLHGFLWF